jgi:hypothetical protein
MSYEFPSTNDEPTLKRLHTSLLDVFSEEPDRVHLDEYGMRIDITGIKDNFAEALNTGRLVDQTDLKSALEYFIHENFDDKFTVTLGATTDNIAYLLIEEKTD